MLSQRNQDTMEVIRYLLNQQELIFRTLTPPSSFTIGISQPTFIRLFHRIIDHLKSSDLAVSSASPLQQSLTEFETYPREFHRLLEVIELEIQHFHRLFPYTDLRIVSDSSRILSEIARQYGGKPPHTQANEAPLVAETRYERENLLRLFVHDVRGCLGVISGAVSLLGMKQSNEEHRLPLVTMIQRNLLYVQDMLSELMELSQLEKSRATLTIGETDVIPVIEETIEKVRSYSPGRRISIQAPAELIVQTDSRKLQTILEKMVSNILRHSYENPIAVSCTLAAEHRWVIQIQNMGKGSFSPQASPVETATSGRYHSFEKKPDSALSSSEPMVDSAPPAAEESNTRDATISIQIIKHLAQTLRASLAMNTGRESFFRLQLPTRYESQ